MQPNEPLPDSHLINYHQLLNNLGAHQQVRGTPTFRLAQATTEQIAAQPSNCLPLLRGGSGQGR